MTEEQRKIRSRVEDSLKPLLTSLQSKRKFMPLGEWMILVENNRNSLKIRPCHYLGWIDHSSEQLIEMVECIFYHFVKKETEFI